METSQTRHPAYFEITFQKVWRERVERFVYKKRKSSVFTSPCDSDNLIYFSYSSRICYAVLRKHGRVVTPGFPVSPCEDLGSILKQ
jgi:hypothetical protein